MILRTLLVLMLLLPASAFAGEVIMQKEGGSWVVRDETGSVIPATDQCQGLTDAISYVTTHGHDLRVIGGQITAAGQDVSVIQCNQTVSFPPMQGARIYFGSVTVNFPNTVQGDGFVFDSCMMCSVDFHGQIVFWGGGKALVFNPRNLLPLDDFVPPTIVDSRFFFQTVAMFGSGPTAADIMGGVVSRTSFTFGELNSETWHGLRVTASEFQSNTVTVRGAHNQNGMAIMNSYQSGFGNHWDVMVEGAQGFYTVGSRDAISITAKGNPSPALTLAPGACDNIILRRALNGPISDNSGCGNRFY